MIARKGHRKSTEPAKVIIWRPPSGLKACIYGALGFLALNFLVQVYRKPTELLRFARLGGARTPRETWREYGDDFRRASSSELAPEFLAALVQVESSGDSLASPAWTWRFSLSPWGIYGPPSSAVGLLQITAGNYAAARGLCGADGRPSVDASPEDPSACRFTFLPSRVNAAHSIALTAAYLRSHVRKVLAGTKRRVAMRDREKLAAVIHLCGPGKGEAYRRARFNADGLDACGSQPVGAYVRRVMAYRALFSGISDK
jgi:hypothetical protein